MDGVFNRNVNSSQNAHFNMAKAALNMMTRTAGDHFVKNNVYMISVDPGLVIDG